MVPLDITTVVRAMNAVLVTAESVDSVALIDQLQVLNRHLHTLVTQHVALHDELIAAERKIRVLERR